MEKGYIPDKPRIGISYYIVNAEAAKLNNVEAGIYVMDISDDCNVAKTELKVGDIITEMNGKAVTDTDVVTEIMSGLKAGDSMTCKVYRPSQKEGAKLEDGEYFEIEFKLNSDKTSMIEQKEKSKE